MRDINRIKPLLESLETLWLQHPDLRFGQLIYVLNEIYNDGCDIFFPEDERWLRWIKKGIRK